MSRFCKLHFTTKGMSRFCKLHFTIFIVLTLSLSGCFRATPIDSAVENAQNSVVALEKSLTADCKTEGTNAQLRAIKSSISEIKENCVAQQKILEEQKTKWQILFLGAVGIIALLLWRKFRI